MLCSWCGATIHFTDSAEPVADADIARRRPRDHRNRVRNLIDGPLAHIPSGRFGANSAWCCARRGDTCRSGPRGRLPAPQNRQHSRLARPQRHPFLHLPSPLGLGGRVARLWRSIIGHSPPIAVPSLTQPEHTGRAGQTSRCPAPTHPQSRSQMNGSSDLSPSVDSGLDRRPRLKTDPWGSRGTRYGRHRLLMGRRSMSANRRGRR